MDFQTEAINSIVTWYERAAVCYVFLEDVFLPDGLLYWRMDAGFQKRISSSSWFTRGWTLQELLAPKNVIFSDGNWHRIGDKHDFYEPLFATTGIGRVFLMGWDLISSASVAQRMSWASKRVTTRPEDMAYSLLGIFSVNMPLLYGKGHRAFIRLQEEIMKVSDDQSIFAWKDLYATWENRRGFHRPTSPNVPILGSNCPSLDRCQVLLDYESRAMLGVETHP